MTDSGQGDQTHEGQQLSEAIDISFNLPRSKRDHAPNGMAFHTDASGTFLYLAQAGITNAGVPGPVAFGWDAPETDGSGAILKINVITGAYSRYVTGLRNPYKPLWHSNGKLYSNDNGPNGVVGVPLMGTFFADCRHVGTHADCCSKMN